LPAADDKALHLHVELGEFFFHVKRQEGVDSHEQIEVDEDCEHTAYEHKSLLALTFF